MYASKIYPLGGDIPQVEGDAKTTKINRLCKWTHNLSIMKISSNSSGYRAHK